MLDSVKSFFHKHPIESTLLGGVAVFALYVALKPSGNSGQSQEAALQNAYFQAESIQAQSGAAVQVANIQAGRDTALATIAADVSKSNATTYANEAMSINSENTQAAVAALPYNTESDLIQALYGVSQQTTSTSKQSSGFLGIGAGSKTTTGPTPAATNAGNYLAELANGLFAHNG